MFPIENDKAEEDNSVVGTGTDFAVAAAIAGPPAPAEVSGCTSV